jgi:hypothetical protein
VIDADKVPPTLLPVKLMSLLMSELTLIDSSKVSVKLIVEALVGLFCPAATAMVGVGGRASALRNTTCWAIYLALGLLVEETESVERGAFPRILSEAWMLAPSVFGWATVTELFKPSGAFGATSSRLAKKTINRASLLLTPAGTSTLSDV